MYREVAAMENRKMFLPALLSMTLVFGLILPASALDMASVMAQGQVTPMVAAGAYHTVGLKLDGTVVAVGYDGDGQCVVCGWVDIIEVAAGGGYEGGHTVGLKDDGTVVAVGDNGDGQCGVGGWTNIRQASAGGWHTIGVKTDGTVVAVGWNRYGQCEVSGWTDITQVSAGSSHTVGLKDVGTVVAVGLN